MIDTSKVYLPFLLTLWLIDTREKLFWLIATVAGSLGLLAVKGGIFAIATGFSYRTWGPEGTQFGGNNEFALATLIIVPLLVLVMREVKDLRAKYALMAAIPLCMASAISSNSRGAFLTLGVVIIMLLWHSKRKWMVVPVIFLGGVLAFQTLPDQWFERMETIETYEEDQSAMSRIRVWKDGINYALKNPLTGAGFDGWRYVTERDWHSAYVEALAEHGFPGFLLWLSLLYGSIFSLTNLGRKVKTHPGTRMGAQLFIYVADVADGLRGWEPVPRVDLLVPALSHRIYGRAYQEVCPGRTGGVRSGSSVCNKTDRKQSQCR